MGLENKVIKNISFKNDNTGVKLEENFLSIEEVNNVLTDNMGKVGREWFKFQTIWAYNAYNRFKDMDKYLILVYLIQKTFKHYSDTFIIISEETFYSREEFEIEKLNLIEISEDLQIPKETIRRKINELNMKDIIARQGKKVTIKLEGFAIQRPKTSITMLSRFLSVITEFLSKDPNFLSESINKENIEDFIRGNYTLIWRYFFRLQIPTLIKWRKFYGDLESWLIAGTIIVNQTEKLKDKFQGKRPVILDGKNLTNDEKFSEWMKFVVANNEEVVGVNASSIAEITGIPRATVIRKLKYLKKRKLVVKDKNKLYVMGKQKTELAGLLKIYKDVQFNIYKFATTFFEIYKNKGDIPKAK
ncbi:MAG: hypothetical protein CBD76_01660 [Pelagibacteraceae bacterium TMED216]|nr:MAG: hypothetical protein CBD76_01660 [Pelagibacteraceae bacterium TMED216]|tara:strand:- start:331 stop:1407 length:1077 start_codon:yes stop_codon:yes gene_type:complete